MMKYQTIIAIKKANIARIKLNRPNAKNAINEQMLIELEEFILSFNRDISFCIISGFDDFFSAGGDIKDMSEFTKDKALEVSIRAQRVFNILETGDFISIALVSGLAYGGGLEMALACNVVFASINTKFCMPEMSLGIIPGGGGTVRFANIAGNKAAFYYITSGKVFDALKAQELGIVSNIFEDNLEEKTMEYIHSMKNLNAKTLVSLKHQLSKKDSSLNDLYNNESKLFSETISDDDNHALKKFLNRKK